MSLITRGSQVRKRQTGALLIVAGVLLALVASAVAIAGGDATLAQGGAAYLRIVGCLALLGVGVALLSFDGSLFGGTLARPGLKTLAFGLVGDAVILGLAALPGLQGSTVMVLFIPLFVIGWATIIGAGLTTLALLKARGRPRVVGAAFLAALVGMFAVYTQGAWGPLGFAVVAGAVLLGFVGLAWLAIDPPSTPERRTPTSVADDQGELAGLRDGGAAIEGEFDRQRANFLPTTPSWGPNSQPAAGMTCGRCHKPLSPAWRGNCKHCGAAYAEFPPVSVATGLPVDLPLVDGAPGRKTSRARIVVGVLLIAALLPLAFTFLYDPLSAGSRSGPGLLLAMGTGGSECVVTEKASSFRLGEPVRAVLTTLAAVPSGSTVTVRMEHNGAELERQTIPFDEAADTCAYMTWILDEVGHYRVVYELQPRVMPPISREFDVTP